MSEKGQRRKTGAVWGIIIFFTRRNRKAKKKCGERKIIYIKWGA